MHITLIGTGNMGAAFARQLDRAGHRSGSPAATAKAQALAEQFPMSKPTRPRKPSETARS